MWIGYARVSSIGQKEGSQLDELLKYGVEEGHIFVDRQGGKDFHRAAYIKI